MKKDWYKSKAVWGAILVFVAGGLEAVGATGALGIVQAVAGVVGLPLTAYGLRDAQK
jgi:hypothetical protein